MQKTLVLIKPDAMERGLAGEIISRFERVDLKIVACKLVQAGKELASAHYPVTDEWLSKVGNNTLSDSQKYGVSAKEIFGTEEAIAIGKMVHKWNMAFILSGPVLALVLEGTHAIEVVRKLCGPTLPLLASPGTIRGDFSSESALSSNMKNQPIRNLVHASGSVEEAKREIKLWFSHD
ncbi:nucleoside-diphosphate kinase [Candidatus Daviesbacteria bacterium]|nr:nucleoside-diphosphate kinase [Candidatus Daviesbacteria bacterium]